GGFLEGGPPMSRRRTLRASHSSTAISTDTIPRVYLDLISLCFYAKGNRFAKSILIAPQHAQVVLRLLVARLEIQNIQKRPFRRLPVAAALDEDMAEQDPRSYGLRIQNDNLIDCSQGRAVLLLLRLRPGA